MLFWIPLLPLIGFLINSVAGRMLPKRASGMIASLAMMTAFGASVGAVRALVLAARGIP